MNDVIDVDFYFSKCSSNYEYIEKLKLSKNVTLHEYSVSSSSTNIFSGLINYGKMLKDIFLNRHSYKKIHFMWSIFFLFECLLFISIRKKLIFTFHNPVPHSYKHKVYWPYKVIMRLATKIIFVSNYTMRTFLNNYGSHSNYQLVQHGLMPIENFSDTKIVTNKYLEKAILFWGRVEEYKGVDIFTNLDGVYPVEIYGKWSPDLASLKNILSKVKNILVYDKYLEFDELKQMLSRDVIFILPYKDASQSGILFTLLAYNKVFISSNVGENNSFLIKHGLEELIFDRNEPESLNKAIKFAFEEYYEIRSKLFKIKDEYQWKHIMSKRKIKDLYNL